MDLQSFLRMQNLFGPLNNDDNGTMFGGAPNIANDTLGSNTQPDDTNQSLLSQFQPRNAISSQLTNTLQNMPERPVPSRLRNIGAAIAGMGAGSSPLGIAGGQPIGFRFNPQAADYASDKVKYGDFDNRMNDYQNKVKSEVLGANEEDRANAGEVKRLAGEAKNDIDQQKVQVAQQRADSYQQNADTLIQKEKDIHATAMQKHADNIAQADAKLALAKQNYELHKNNTEYMQKYHDAELASISARREAQTEDDKFKLDDQKRRTDSQIEHQRILNEALANGKTTSTDYIYDKPGGNIIGKKVSTGKVQKMVPVIDKDGNAGSVPEDKVEEFIRDHGGKRVQ